MAAAAASSIPAVAASVASQVQGEAETDAGYRETDHVKKYYSTAKL